MSIFDGMSEQEIAQLLSITQGGASPSLWESPIIEGGEPAMYAAQEEPTIPEPPKPPNQYMKDVSGFANYGMEAPAIPQMPGISSIPDASQPGGAMNFPEHQNQSQLQGMPGAPNYAQAPPMQQQQQQLQQQQPLPMQPPQQMPNIQDQSIPQQLGDPMQRIQSLMSMLDQSKQKEQTSPMPEGGIMAYLQSLGG